MPLVRPAGRRLACRRGRPTAPRSVSLPLLRLSSRPRALGPVLGPHSMRRLSARIWTVFRFSGSEFGLEVSCGGPEAARRLGTSKIGFAAKSGAGISEHRPNPSRARPRRQLGPLIRGGQAQALPYRPHCGRWGSREYSPAGLGFSDRQPHRRGPGSASRRRRIRAQSGGLAAVRLSDQEAQRRAGDGLDRQCACVDNVVGWNDTDPQGSRTFG